MDKAGLTLDGGEVLLCPRLDKMSIALIRPASAFHPTEPLRLVSAKTASACNEDLGPGDFVRVQCVACEHDEMISPASLQLGFRLAPETLIFDLEPRFRCRECDAKGKPVVTVRWLDQNRRSGCIGS